MNCVAEIVYISSQILGVCDSNVIIVQFLQLQQYQTAHVLHVHYIMRNLYLIHVELAHNNYNNFRQEWGMGTGLLLFYSTHWSGKSLAPSNVKDLAKYRTRNLS